MTASASKLNDNAIKYQGYLYGTFSRFIFFYILASGLQDSGFYQTLSPEPINSVFLAERARPHPEASPKVTKY